MAEKIVEHSSISMYEQDQTKYSIVVNRRRAFPEVRDSLKPVQRRVIYGAFDDGLTRPSKKDKSASLVGTVMKQYHPHGDCVRGCVKLYSTNGVVDTISNIYNSGTKSLEILAVDPATQQVVPAIAHSFRIGQYTNKVYHVQLSNGEEICCTANHPFKLPYSPVYVKAEELRPYMRLEVRNLNLNDRPRIDNTLVQDMVYNYYYGPLEEGYVKHHKDENIYNNSRFNFEKLTKRDHIGTHYETSDVYKHGLDVGRKEMFDEDGKFREQTRRKNSILASQYNKEQGVRRFKYAIGLLEEQGLPITEENYESLRGKIYNLPIVERLIKRNPEYGTCFEDLVNLQLPSLSELYAQAVANIQCPIEINELKPESPIDFISMNCLGAKQQIFNAINRIIDGNLPYTVESYYSNTSTTLEPWEVAFYMELYKYQCPFITNIWIEDVDNEPMYDFTVDGHENMLIPCGNTMNSPYSHILGNTMPMICIHNSSIYEAIVTLANWFKVKMPLFYGKGNWGNVLGSSAAAMRYTECSLSEFGYDVLIDELAQSRNIVDWIPTYKRDGSKEPEFLPAKVPLLLINGSFGIGVGMSINIPSHNLIEVLEATRTLIKNPKSEIVLIPDLCQSCKLIDTDWKSICDTGRGSFKVRGNIEIETNKKGNIILHITSLPEMVTTTAVYDKIMSMIEQKQLPMIKDVYNSLTDEKPDIEIHLKPGADPNYVKQVIYAKTDVQKTVSVNFEAVDVNGIDTRRFSYKDYLLTFIDQRMNIKFRLYCNKLQQVMTRHHHIDAFVKVLESGEIDTIIKMIRKHKGTDESTIIEYMIKKCNLTDLQAKFIINTNLGRLSIGHLNNYKAERKKLEEDIKAYRAAVTDDGTIIRKEIDAELLEIEKKYGTPRLCRVINIDEENQIPEGTFKIVITERNYVRKIPDVDKIGIVKKDNPKFILKVDNRENLLIFDNKGKVFNLPVSKIPITDRNGSGTDIRILIKNLTSDIISVYYEPIFKNIASCGKKHYLTILTKSNTIKKLDIEDFLSVNPSGLMYSKIKDDDEVVGIALTPHNLDVVICSGHNALRTTMKYIPLFKRNAAGSRAMDTMDPINGLSVIYPDVSDIVVVTKNGKFNRFHITMLPSYVRARKGVGVIKLDSNDEIFNIFGVNESDKIRLVTSEGVEEIPVTSIKSKSRLAAGTKLLTSKGVIIRADIVR